jgi:hypothetical protein
MNYDEHLPPHFHVQYAEYNAQIVIATAQILEGTLPSRAFAMVREWTELHREELDQNWRRRGHNLPLNPIEPLK